MLTFFPFLLQQFSQPTGDGKDWFLYLLALAVAALFAQYVRVQKSSLKTMESNFEKALAENREQQETALASIEKQGSEYRKMMEDSYKELLALHKTTLEAQLATAKSMDLLSEAINKSMSSKAA
ncbi:MAG: hypothetical protein HRU40_08305 [Saprospiraceae bacterium]|nr:hypothetical protein [Saprospiraceae bacterium]